MEKIISFQNIEVAPYVSFAGAKLIQVDFSKVLLAEEINFQDAQIVDCKFPEEVGSGLLYHENR